MKKITLTLTDEQIKSLKEGDKYWIIGWSKPVNIEWSNESEKQRDIKAGLVFRTKQEALDHRNRLLGVK